MGRLAGRGGAPRLGREPSRFAARSDADQIFGQRRSKNWLTSARWRRLRLRVLERDNFTCQQTGRACLGRHPAPDSPVVDHIVPHRGDEELFWDESNLQTVSKEWHDRVKQGQEKRGEV